MIRLHGIKVSEGGKRIDYEYCVDKKYSEYFSRSNPFYVEYSIDVSSVPYSLAVIPFLSNIMPIAWFLGCEVYVDEVDSSFLNSLRDIKQELSKEWKAKHLGGDLFPGRTVTNTISGIRYLMLYSGGVDSLVTFLRQRGRPLDLVTVLGADIPVDDKKQWQSVLRFIDSEKLLSSNRKYHIKSNLRDFYTYRVDLLVDVGWWAKVQHGLALLGVNAPMSFVNGYKEIYLASSDLAASQARAFAWGSHPRKDDKISWADVVCKNDGSELSRQGKIDFLVKWNQDAKTAVKVRVCYSELNNSLNCSNCEKCFRTILAIVLAGGDPNVYGFKVDSGLYQRVFTFFKNIRASDPGMAILWNDIAERAVSNRTFHVLADKVTESEYVNRIAAGELSVLLKRNTSKGSRAKRLKFVLRNQFPRLYRSYRSFRHIIEFAGASKYHTVQTGLSSQTVKD